MTSGKSKQRSGAHSDLIGSQLSGKISSAIQFAPPVVFVCENVRYQAHLSDFGFLPF